MANTRLELTIIGAPEDNRDVRFDDLIRQLDAFKDAFSETERILEIKGSVDYRVTGMRHSSAVFQLEAISPHTPDAEQLVDTFYDTIGNLLHNRPVSPKFDREALEAYRKLVVPRTRIAGVNISRNGTSHQVGEALVPRVLAAQYKLDYVYEHGSVTGNLQHSNTHGHQAIFTVFPTDRQPRVRCVVPKSLVPDFYRAGDHYVTVYGRFKYNLNDRRPLELSAERLEVHPPEDELPTLASLRGITSGSIGKQTSEDFVREIRDEWEQPASLLR